MFCVDADAADQLVPAQPASTYLPTPGRKASGAGAARIRLAGGGCVSLCFLMTTWDPSLPWRGRVLRGRPRLWASPSLSADVVPMRVFMGPGTRASYLIRLIAPVSDLFCLKCPASVPKEPQFAKSPADGCAPGARAERVLTVLLSQVVDAAVLPVGLRLVRSSVSVRRHGVPALCQARTRLQRTGDKDAFLGKFQVT